MKGNPTIGKKYDPAMEITDQGKADAYFEECVQHTMSFGKNRAEAEDIERQNPGVLCGLLQQRDPQENREAFSMCAPDLRQDSGERRADNGGGH